MALQINDPNFSGIASRAGGQLDLPNAGALGLQALQIRNQDRQAQQALAMQKMQLRVQDEQALRARIMEGQKQSQLNYQAQQQQGMAQNLLADQKTQASLLAPLQQQEAARKNLVEDRNFGLNLRQQGFSEEQAKQKQMEDTIKQETLKLTERKKEDIASMGAFAVQSKVAMDQVTDPQEARSLQLSILDNAEKQGYIKKEEAAAMRAMPVDGFKNVLGFKVSQLNRVSELMALKKEASPDKGKDGNITITDSSGRVIQISGQSAEGKNKTQEAYTDAKEGLGQLEKFANPPEEFFGLAAAAQSITQTRELGKIIPGVAPSRESVETMAKYKEYEGNASLQIMKTAKAMAGSRFSDTDLNTIEKIMPQVGMTKTKAEYGAKFNLVHEYLTALRDSKEKILKDGGLTLGTEEYDAAMSKEIQNNYHKIFEAPRKDYSKMTQAELDAAIAAEQGKQ